jgi:hypothetical protein
MLTNRKMKLAPIPFKKSLIVIVLSILFATSCGEDNEIDKVVSAVQSDQVDAELLEYIASIGYDISSIVSNGDEVIVEGDVSFSKKWKYPSPSNRGNTGGRTEQATFASGVVAYSKINNITVRTAGTMPGAPNYDYWNGQLMQAVDDWNSIPTTRIHLQYITSGIPDIWVTSDAGTLADNQVAQADAPHLVSGVMVPGSVIKINLDSNNDTHWSDSQKRRVLVHELGHCIGFRHTDWGISDANPKTDKANHIPGTPCADQSSVMQSCCAAYGWGGFSGRDWTAAQLTFPIDRPAGTGPLYRYALGNDHFYTMNWNEINCANGWGIAEGFEGFLYSNQVSGTVPIYRYASGTDHFYTRFFTTYAGYNYEGVVGYGYSSQVAGTIPIFRYYNGGTGDHFYTMYNTTFPGYVSEGIAWYAFL